ncbi:CLUMA_CG020239, isoform A [Clunio marinus]|uniref:CLUMA_CG020239, isoform A n=1 Tax=Clunio marinus TaxID=568069 RepID=A0A1J1J4D8_9DIPT|nr:CLUMA_CG020239, isoform A [Clunio marinus]
MKKKNNSDTETFSVVFERKLSQLINKNALRKYLTIANRADLISYIGDEASIFLLCLVENKDSSSNKNHYYCQQTIDK